MLKHKLIDFQKKIQLRDESWTSHCIQQLWKLLSLKLSQINILISRFPSFMNIFRLFKKKKVKRQLRIGDHLEGHMSSEISRTWGNGKQNRKRVAVAHMAYDTCAARATNKVPVHAVTVGRRAPIHPRRPMNETTPCSAPPALAPPNNWTAEDHRKFCQVTRF